MGPCTVMKQPVPMAVGLPERAPGQRTSGVGRSGSLHIWKLWARTVGAVASGDPAALEEALSGLTS
jgi:hypothetical protein